MPWITKLHIQNLLSLKNIEIELNKLNIFVGPNASGKSNIIKALQLLKNHAKNGIPSLPGYESFKDIAHNFDQTTTIHLEVEMNTDHHNIRYTLTLTADNYLEQAWIDDKEALRSEGRAPTAQVLTQNGTTTSFYKGPQATINFYIFPLHRSALTQLPGNAAKELHALARTLRTITTHSFTPERIRARSSIKAPPTLTYHGDNLARTLLHLYLENRKAFADIEDMLKNLIPEIQEIIPHLEDDKVEIWLRTRDLAEPLKPANISDGTLRILAYTTALHSNTSLAAFEEPENCIHPHLLETLIDLARKAPCQVIITTHSPYLLDHTQPEEVYLVQKPKTATIIKKLTKTKELQAVKQFLEQGGTLGEAWYSGLIGGIPETP